MFSLAGTIGSFVGDKGETNTVRNVKSPAIQARIDSGLSDYDTVRSKGDTALSEYITRYLAGYPDAKKNTGQEIGSIDRYYSGDAESELARMRSARTKALMDATDRSSRYALANVNSSRIGNEGGSSSYDKRLLLKSMNDIGVQAAMDDAVQTRSDWDYLERAKLGLLGQRSTLANALAGYGLVPENVRRQMYGQNLGYLSNLTNLDQANNFYGLEYEPSVSEIIQGAADKDMATVTNLISAVRGGSPTATAPQPSGNTQWGTSPNFAQSPAASLGYGSPSFGSIYGYPQTSFAGSPATSLSYGSPSYASQFGVGVNSPGLSYDNFGGSAAPSSWSVGGFDGSY